MRRPLIIAMLLTLPLIHGCSGGSSEDTKVTQTRMDDIDSIKGTISDDMINTDESTDTAPVDAAPAEVATPPKKVSAKPDKKAVTANTATTAPVAPAPAPIEQ